MTAVVDGAGWDRIAADLNEYGCGLTPQLLTPQQCGELAALYGEDRYFRSTIVMGRHRFGEGEYRYFDRPFPDPIEPLKQALYPHLLPIARDWYRKLGRRAPWPDTLDEWLDMCHAAGQTRATPILLRYREQDWNALHRDLYGDLVFPLQVVINLSNPAPITPAASSCWSSSGPGPSPAAPRRSSRRATAWSSPPATGRSRQNAAGQRHRSGTGSR